MKTLTITILLATLTVSSVALAQQSHTIVCRGGGNLYFNYTPFSSFSPNPQIWITFERGLKGAGLNWENSNDLSPGQCTWLDRSVSTQEPDRIIIKGVKNFTVQWSKGLVMGISSELSYLNVLRDSNRYQSFNAYNDTKGNFIVTNIGPSR